MLRLLGCVCWGLLLFGCGRSDPALAPVGGEVFHHGKPLAGGTIVFTPDRQRGGRGPQAVAEVGPDGRFHLRTSGKPGAVPGWHRVTVAPCGPTPAPLSPRFRDPELSGLSFEVKPERVNRCELHLD
jgi:hypothetical protein